MGDCKSLQGWSNLFRRRISNPPERLTDCKSAGTPNGIYPYALKGQKLLAQGIALGIINGNLSPLQGALHQPLHPGRCPGLGASALSGRMDFSGINAFILFFSLCVILK